MRRLCCWKYIAYGALFDTGAQVNIGISLIGAALSSAGQQRFKIYQSIKSVQDILIDQSSSKYSDRSNEFTFPINQILKHTDSIILDLVWSFLSAHDQFYAIICLMLLPDTDNVLSVWDNQLQLLSCLDNLVSKKGKVWSMIKLLSVLLLLHI